MKKTIANKVAEATSKEVAREIKLLRRELPGAEFPCTFHFPTPVGVAIATLLEAEGLLVTIKRDGTRHIFLTVDVDINIDIYIDI
jgi:hypothetical protein